MSGNDDRGRGTRPIIPEFLESQDLIDPSPVFTKKRRVHVPRKLGEPRKKSVLTKPDESTTNKTATKPDESTNKKAATKPDESTNNKAATKPDESTNNKAATKPDESTNNKAATKPDESTNNKAATKSDESTNNKAATKPDESTNNKVATNSDESTNNKAATKSDESTNNKAATKSDESRNKSEHTKSTYSRKKRLFRKSPGSSQRRIDVMWGYNINDDSGLQADMSPSEDTSSPVSTRKIPQPPQNNQPSTTASFTGENQDKLQDLSTDDEVSTHTRSEPRDQLNDEGILNTQESLFDGDFWIATKYAGNTPYSFTFPDSSTDTSDDDVFTHDDDVFTHTSTETGGENMKNEGIINTQESLFDSPFAVNTPYPVDASTPYREDTPHPRETRNRAGIPYPWHTSPQSSPSTSNPPLRFDFSDDSCASESFQKMLKETFNNVIVPETPLTNQDNDGTETITWGTQAFTPNLYIDLFCNTKTSQTDLSGLTGQHHKLFNRQLGPGIDLSAWTAGYHDEGLPDRSERFTQTSETGGYLVDKSVQTGMGAHFTGIIYNATYLCEWYSKPERKYRFCDRSTQTILL